MLLSKGRTTDGIYGSVVSDTRRPPTPGSARTCTTAPGWRSRVYRRIRDVDLFLGHHTVHDAERADLLGLRFAGRDEQVVRVRPAGDVRIGAGGVCLGGRVRV